MKKYFLILSILNLFDGISTSIVLTKNITNESNLLMETLWNLHPTLFIGLKVLLSLVLIYLAYNFKTTRNLKLWIKILQLCCVAYITIFFVHITWIIIYLFFL